MIFIEESGNKKLSNTGNVCATYVSISNTCPASCALKDKGCYAQLGYVGYHLRRIEKQLGNLPKLEIAKREAKAIRSCFNGGPVPDNRPCRLHVSGDTTIIAGAKVIGRAVVDYKARGGGEVWTYTHAWKTVPRSAWGPSVSILASVDSLTEVPQARKQGYAPAIVVPLHTSDKAQNIKGTTFVPCPQQTRGVACTTCKLCLNADALYARKAGIAFAAHGARKDVIKRKLPVWQ